MITARVQERFQLDGKLPVGDSLANPVRGRNPDRWHISHLPSGSCHHKMEAHTQIVNRKQLAKTPLVTGCHVEVEPADH